MNGARQFVGNFKQNAAQQSEHPTLGILRHLRQAFSSLRVFSTPKQSPRPPQRQ